MAIAMAMAMAAVVKATMTTRLGTKTMQTLSPGV